MPSHDDDQDFGYRLDPLGEGDGVFAYWDQNNVWPELELILKEPFSVNGVGQNNEYMVSPPEFVASPEKLQRLPGRDQAGERQLEICLLRLRSKQRVEVSPPPDEPMVQGWRTVSMA